MKPFIALDWGTTSFRAYEVNSAGEVLNQISATEGILAVKDGAFDGALESHIGTWDKTLPIVASGMITSRQGWVECAYAECPAGISDLAKSITTKTTAAGRKVHFITGLHYKSPTIAHDVLRGEETQVFGSLASSVTHFITPGTHSKWISIANDKIAGFDTYMTGETFALYRNHSILARLMQDGVQDNIVFAMGVEKAFEAPADMLHQLFAVRTLGLFNQIAPDQLASYLSGLLIGSEVASASMGNDHQAKYMVLGSPALAANYLTALKLAGLKAEAGDPLCAIKGQQLIAHEAGII